MMLTKRAVFILISMLFLAVTISCDLLALTPTTLPTAAIPDTAIPVDTATPTITPTATITSTPTLTATPVTRLARAGCPYLELCPGAVHMIYFYDGEIVAGSPVEIAFPYDTPTLLQFVFRFIDQQHYDQYVQNLSIFFRIDGVSYLDSSMIYYGDITLPSGTYPSDAFGVVLTDWIPGVPHTLEFGYTVRAPINDGWQEYQPQTVTYTILAMPYDPAVGTLTPNPDATAFPTVTVMP